jgi:hypothetical protein
VDNSIFFVNDQPYCLWDQDIEGRCRDFLGGLDPEYFNYAFSAHLETEDEKRASVALRLALHHGLETFFSLVGAFVQARDCPFAWLSKCSTRDLRAVVERISKGDAELFTKLKMPSFGWPGVAHCTYFYYMPGTERQTQVVDGFGKLWQRLAGEFLSDSHIAEYNSLKHGFRVRSGGFGVSIAASEDADKGKPEGPLIELGRSETGSSFYIVEPVSDRRGERSLVVSHQSVNWSIERLVLLNQLTYMSISNIVNALRIYSGTAPSACAFLVPEDHDAFAAPWRYSPGVIAATIRTGHASGVVRSLSREDILKAMEEHAKRELADSAPAGDA